MTKNPEAKDPSTWGQYKLVALVLTLTSIIGAVGVLGGLFQGTIAWVRDQIDPYREERISLQELRLGMTEQRVNDIFGAPLARRSLKDIRDGSVDEKIESAYRRGDSWIQAIWYDNSLVLYTVEVCNAKVQPKFRMFGGQELVINKSTFADVSQEPTAAVYSVPVSNPGPLLEGDGALHNARSTEAQNNKLEYWGVGQLCNKYIDWSVNCFPPPSAPYPSQSMCGDVPIDKTPGVRELRARTVITTYGQRSDLGGTTGYLAGLDYSFVREFLE
ncbi:MAG: hypothetical protein M3460_23650 [Actinomycetota bacterium]|nr:hypothetical protein [Actinomycetota bacterium]